MDFVDFLNKIKSITLAELNDYFEDELVQIIKYINSSIHESFFYDETSVNKFDIYSLITNNLNELAIKHISYIISKTNDYRFNVTVNINLDTLLHWYNANESTVGLLMYKKFLIDKRGMLDYFQNSTSWAEFLTVNMTKDTFLTGIFEEMLAQSSTTVIYLLNALRLIDSDEKNYQKVIGVISSQYNCIYEVEKYEWFKLFKINGLENNSISEKVRRSIVELSSTQKFTDDEFVASPVGGGGYIVYVKKIRKTYGLRALNWINGDYGPKLYNLRTSSNPSNVEEIPDNEDSGGGCVLKGTKILMADNSYKLIEEIKEWDKVYSKDGAISVCSNELIINNKLTNVYSINSDKPFMSLEHAILTRRGWCSLNPYLSNEINPHFDVQKLEVGDVVIKVKKVKDRCIEYEEEIVKKINVENYIKGSIEAYDIHFREGYLSYHCNDYLCLLNYPEITGKKIMDNIFNRLNDDERELFFNLISENLYIFQKIFGKVSLDYFNLK